VLLSYPVHDAKNVTMAAIRPYILKRIQ